MEFIDFMNFLVRFQKETFLIEIYIKLDFLQIMKELCELFFKNNVLNIEKTNRDFFLFFKDNLRILNDIKESKDLNETVYTYLNKFDSFPFLIQKYSLIKHCHN